MFIRSYATYISPYPATKKTNFQKEENSVKNTTPFNLQKEAQTQAQQTDVSKSLQKEPVLSSYTIFQQQKSNKDLQKFNSIKSYKDAKVAYKENSFMYSLAQKPKNVIGGQQVDLQLPKEAQTLKESLSKREMINTYVENENYYRITAA